MPLAKLIRYAGLAAICAGVLRSVAAFIPSTTPGVKVLYFFTDLFIFWGIIGIYGLLGAGSRGWGRSGFWLALIGAGLLMMNDIAPAWANLYAVAALVFTAGLSLLAIGAWVANKLPRWIAVFWLLSTAIGIVGFFAPRLMVLFALSGVMFGVSFVGVGVEVWRFRGKEPIS